jgi:hypothetical protein
MAEVPTPGIAFQGTFFVPSHFKKSGSLLFSFFIQLFAAFVEAIQSRSHGWKTKRHVLPGMVVHTCNLSYSGG